MDVVNTITEIHNEKIARNDQPSDDWLDTNSFHQEKIFNCGSGLILSMVFSSAI